MKNSVALAAFALVLLASTSANAAFEIALDFTPGSSPPITTTATGLTGSSFAVDVYLTQTGSDDLRVYGFGIDYNASQLTLDSATHSAPGTLTFPTVPSSLNNGRFQAIGATAANVLADGSYLLGTLNFTVSGLTAGQTANITPFFNQAIDPSHGFARGNLSVVPGGDLAFSGGSFTAVPEPNSVALLAIGLGITGFRRRRQ